MENLDPENLKTDHRFPVTERLKHKKDIEELFSRGSSLFLYPFLVKYTPAKENNTRHKILISVSKKNFKKAVDRNKIKRQIREAYRLNKQLIYPPDKPTRYHIALIYVGKEINPFQKIQNKLIKALKRLPL